MSFIQVIIGRPEAAAIRQPWRHLAGKSVNDLAGEQFDLVVTVCDRAREQCPLFPGPVKKIHLSFADPARVRGSEDEIMAVFRKVRAEMREKLLPLLTREAEGK